MDENAGRPTIELVILEYWDVYPDKLDAFRDWFVKYYFGSLSHCPGYVGMTYMHQHPGAHETCFGQPESGQVITYHPLISQLGTLTNASVNFDVLLRNEYNVVVAQFISDRSTLGELFANYMKGFEQVRPGWRDEHPDLESPVQVVEREFFSMIKNHWDVFLDVTDTLWNTGPVTPATLAASR